MTPAFELNGVTYDWPKRPVVVVCIDGGDPGVLRAGTERRNPPQHPQVPGARLQRRGKRRHAQLHQPEQHVDRDRQPSVGAWHIG